MKYSEKIGDLFSETDCFYAHCISADYALGAGIAVLFDDKYGMRQQLHQVGKHRYPDCIMIDNVANLVTKEMCYDEPIYPDLKKALELLRDQIAIHNIKKLAIPRIGCGIDGLRWSQVSAIIKEVFSNADLEIVVCSLN